MSGFCLNRAKAWSTQVSSFVGKTSCILVGICRGPGPDTDGLESVMETEGPGTGGTCTALEREGQAGRGPGN